MTAPEYIQLKAFARIDGARLSLLWIASFAFYVMGLKSPGYSLAGFILAFATPFFAGFRLKHFRDEGLEGTISLMRGWAYVILIFFYGGLLFALAQWAYLTYLDQGFLMDNLASILSAPETMQALRQFGMGDSAEENLRLMSEMRPIDLSLNMLTTNILIGILLGLPIAALMQKGKRKSGKGESSEIANP